jgi:hypothetical protein
MSEENLIGFQPQAEPPFADMFNGDGVDHASFSDILSTAPYRGWHFLSWSRMRSYIDATLETHKSHIYALREDPSYFADTVLEYE